MYVAGVNEKPGKQHAQSFSPCPSTTFITSSAKPSVSTISFSRARREGGQCPLAFARCHRVVMIITIRKSAATKSIVWVANVRRVEGSITTPALLTSNQLE